jgi:hypothetical protein
MYQMQKQALVLPLHLEAMYATLIVPIYQTAPKNKNNPNNPATSNEIPRNQSTLK